MGLKEMSMRHDNRVKAVMASMIWFMLRMPMDIALYVCQHYYFLYIVSLQVTDFLILAYVFYQFFQYRARRLWKCPACDGWGHRGYVPGLPVELRPQLTRCHACNGTGFVWEQISGGQL